MAINVNAMLEDLGIENVDKQTLIDRANRAADRVTKAQEALEHANAALAEAQAQPDVVGEARKVVLAMEELGLAEETIKSALRTKFGAHRAPRKDTGADLTDDLKVTLREAIDESGEDGFTTSELADEFEVKRSQVAAWIKTLVEAGSVVQTGTKRGTKYFLDGMVPAEKAA